ncbi:hypothetical protein G9A89_014635 [Geosiphon pyriformis]|nr:hypothetical protein G9A89_014635 [Geosiphon pyriformis]
MADFPEECLLQRDDYFECLHHTKELARARKIRAEEERQQKLRKEEEAKSRRAADSAAKSNVFRLGIIESTENGEREAKTS